MKLNWNLKIWAVVVALMVVLTATGMVLSSKSVEKQSISIVARVNNDGSGIFVQADVDVDSLVTITGDNVEYHREGWAGKLFMTPGPSSIQHMILMDIVKKEMGLNFVQHGAPANSEDAVFWTQVPPGQMKTRMEVSTGDRISGGIAWEPHYAKMLLNGAKSVIPSMLYWGDHPCCIVAINNAYMKSHGEQVKRFLAGYVKSVVEIDQIISEGSGERYEDLIRLVIKIGSTEKEPLSREAAIKALQNTKYTFAINNLVEQLVQVAETYRSLDLFKEEALTNAGFENIEDFLNNLVQEEALASVVNESGQAKTPGELGLDSNSYQISVAYLAADTHQIALHYGIEKGYFKEYGINVNLVGPFAAGGEVMSALLSQHAQLGFVGSPPAVLQSINALR